MSVHTLQIKQITTNITATIIMYVTFRAYLFINLFTIICVIEQVNNPLII